MGTTTNTWRRVYGPSETCECGDVEYEIGSTYEDDGNMTASIIYFVEAAPRETFAVWYKCESWKDGDFDNPTTSYDLASALSYDSLDEAIAKAKSFAAEDESYVFM